MKHLSRIFLLIFAGCYPLLSGFAALIDGQWSAQFETQVGVQKYVYTLHGEGETLTGSAAWERMGEKGTVQLQAGRIVGDAVSFSEPIKAMGQDLVIVYRGTLAGDELRLTRTVGEFATEELVAKRVSPDASAAPAAPPGARLAPIQAGPLAGGNPARVLAPGPFKPTWPSLSENYRAPDWFRDAKFGIWAHWSAQCVPEFGDWYARHMYLQGYAEHAFHTKTYGHPADFGFMEIENLWKAENWDPARLMDLYKRAGAKYFVALANHHDNFDAYDSKYHAWNSVNVGPKKDIVGTWAKVARERGLKFGVSNHSAHAWHWYQTAYGYDAEGPRAGERYDAFKLKKEDGKGKWWEGLDPQDLYTGPNMVIPDGFTSSKAALEWHEKNDRVWNENPPAMNPRFTDTWFLRTQDLVDKYRPDLLYFDNFALPLGQAGLDIAAHFYNANLAWHDSTPNAVLNIKGVSPERRGAVIDDIERGVAEGIRAAPWQTDTCIGSWHYDRRLFEQHKYKTVGQVVRMLADIVSKNGNLLLSIPVRADGTLDADEIAFLEGMAKWMDVNSEAIFATRPWTVYGEGPSVEEKAEAGHFGGAKDVRSKPYTSEDIRFTTKSGAVYAILMDWPATRTASIKAVAGHRVSEVSLLGYSGKLTWTQDQAGLHVQLPETAPSEHAVVLKIGGL